MSCCSSCHCECQPITRREHEGYGAGGFNTSYDQTLSDCCEAEIMTQNEYDWRLMLQEEEQDANTD